MRKGSRIFGMAVLIIILAVTLLIIDVLIAAVWLKSSSPVVGYDIMPAEVIKGFERKETGYELSADITEKLDHSNQFAMFMDYNGVILWSYHLPVELERQYTVADAVRFSRYYLNDYPVHSVVTDEGIMVLGGQKDSIWKYQLEWPVATVKKCWQILPWILLSNLLILVLVPLYVERRWLRKQEMERTEWIAGVSHDIRTPLTLLLGEADYLKKSPDTAIAERAEVIEAQGLRIRTLISNLNTSNKLSFGMGDFEKKELKLSALLRGILTDILNRKPDSKYEFELDISENMEDFTVVGNRELLRRMIENLLNNSMQYNTDGCFICVRLREEQKGICRLEISDNGVGVSKEKLKDLNRYRKKQKLGEHGIGTRLVKQIAAFHHWKVVFMEGCPNGFVCTVFIKK